MDGLYARPWKQAFLATIEAGNHRQQLLAALDGGKAAWTRAITAAVADACKAMGWLVGARDHIDSGLPVQRAEYLNIDVMAFEPGDRRWRFPIAAFELENQSDDDYIAYDLWKLLCTRTSLRLVCCYRPSANQGRALVDFLTAEVVGALPVHERRYLSGDTVVLIGSHSDMGTFPYGVFRWWLLDKNLGRFQSLKRCAPSMKVVGWEGMCGL